MLFLVKICPSVMEFRIRRAMELCDLDPGWLMELLQE